MHSNRSEVNRSTIQCLPLSMVIDALTNDMSLFVLWQYQNLRIWVRLTNLPYTVDIDLQWSLCPSHIGIPVDPGTRRDENRGGTGLYWDGYRVDTGVYRGLTGATMSKHLTRQHSGPGSTVVAPYVLLMCSRRDCLVGTVLTICQGVFSKHGSSTVHPGRDTVHPGRFQHEHGRTTVEHGTL